jgi:hypothetical protein
MSGKLTLPLLALLDRLDTGERASLLEEVRGTRPPQFPLRLRQMAEHGVFAVVAEAVHAEIAIAAAALDPWSRLAPTPLLLSLCEVLERQVAGLQPPAGT